MVYGLQEAKGRIAKGKCASANEQHFAILLLRAGLVVVRELGFLGQRYLCSVCLVVEGQGLVGILDIVKGLILDWSGVSSDPPGISSARCCRP